MLRWPRRILRSRRMHTWIAIGLFSAIALCWVVLKHPPPTPPADPIVWWNSVQTIDGFEEYRILDNAIRPPRRIEDERVTLVAQTSLSHLKYVPRLCERWDGPISIAVFVPDALEEALKLTLSLRQCSRCIQRWVVFHFVLVEGTTIDYVPQTVNEAGFQRWSEARLIQCKLPATAPHDQGSRSEVGSDGTPDVVTTKLDQELQLLDHEWQNYRSDLPYPNNLLRNVARMGVKTKHIFLIDIDVVPSPQLKEQFAELLSRRGLSADKIAFVVPVFEVDQKEVGESYIEQVQSKVDLLKGFADGYIRPFYFEACLKCQKPTSYEKWFNSDAKVGTYQIEAWKDPWEPFFLCPADVPAYDNRFKQYGFNRISQVCEMWIAGYEFEVLKSAFLLHYGFKQADTSFHSQKEAENAQNRNLYRQFKHELLEKYPKSDRQC